MQNKHVFMVINNSAFASIHVPVACSTAAFRLIGAGYDGTYYGDPGTRTSSPAFGNAAPVVGATYDVTPKIAKAQGATKMASLGYGISPSSTVGGQVQQPSTRLPRPA